MLAVLGASHVVRARHDELEPVGLFIEQELPGVANAVLAPSSGTSWFHGDQEVPSAERPPADVELPIRVSYPAVVPRHPLASGSCVLRGNARGARRL